VLLRRKADHDTFKDSGRRYAVTFNLKGIQNGGSLKFRRDILVTERLHRFGWIDDGTCQHDRLPYPGEGKIQGIWLDRRGWMMST
jgi:hypothetical protein